MPWNTCYNYDYHRNGVDILSSDEKYCHGFYDGLMI